LVASSQISYFFAAKINIIKFEKKTFSVALHFADIPSGTSDNQTFVFSKIIIFNAADLVQGDDIAAKFIPNLFSYRLSFPSCSSVEKTNCF
jgi:hypothetical protein